MEKLKACLKMREGVILQNMHIMLKYRLTILRLLYRENPCL